jgi:type IV pilus assembly protein PilE
MSGFLKRKHDTNFNKLGATITEFVAGLAVSCVLIGSVQIIYEYQRVAANREAAQNFLLESASVQQQFFSATGDIRYAEDTMLFGLAPALSNVTNYYAINRYPKDTEGELTRFTIIAEPLSGTIQAGDGELSINQRGQRLVMNGQNIIGTW